MSATDEFSYHEILDRLNLVNTMIEDFLIEHRLFEHEPGLAAVIKEGADKLADAYQLAGKMRFEKFPGDVTGHAQIEELEETVITLHRSLAAETLRANQGWQRYESANADRNNLRNAMVKDAS